MAISVKQILDMFIVRILHELNRQKRVQVADFGYGTQNDEDLICKELLIINQYEPLIQ